MVAIVACKSGQRQKHSVRIEFRQAKTSGYQGITLSCGGQRTNGRFRMLLHSAENITRHGCDVLAESIHWLNSERDSDPVPA